MADREERERIMAKAQDRFRQYGFAKVTLDELASDLGMSKKTIYKHFESKEELLKEVIRSITRAMSERIERIVSSDLPFDIKAKKLLTDIGTTLGMFSRQLQLDLQRYVPELWTEIEEFRRRQILDKLSRMFEQGIREKAFRHDVVGLLPRNSNKSRLCRPLWLGPLHGVLKALRMIKTLEGRVGFGAYRRGRKPGP